MINKDGCNVFVVIVKGTFRLDPGGKLLVSDRQQAIAFVEEYCGDPETSNVRIPSDLIDYKPGADVIISESAEWRKGQGPFGRKIALEIGPLRKTKRVFAEWIFGPTRRDHKPRSRYAGTYDQDWIKSRMPLLPADFDDRYNLVAPPDQVVTDYLKGDEHVKLTGLYPEGTVEFDLPGCAVVVAGNVMSRYFTEVANLDTLIIWPDSPKVSLVWRYPIRCRKIAEVCNVYVDLVRRQKATEIFGKP